MNLIYESSLVAQMVKRLPAMWETWVRSLGWEDLLEKKMATHSSTLAWKIPRTEEPGRLQSMALQRVEHDWVNPFFKLPIVFTNSFFVVSVLFCFFHPSKGHSFPYWGINLYQEKDNEESQSNIQFLTPCLCLKNRSLKVISLTYLSPNLSHP